MPETRANRWWWLLLIVAVLLRMYLVADDEIVLQEFDSMYYAQAAAYYFSDNPFAILPTHRPGLSILAWSVAELGIPYKLFLDLALIVASIFAGGVLTRLTQSKPTGRVTTLALLFHPWFIVHSQMIMTEALVSLLLLTIVLAAIPFICRPCAEWTVGSALVSSLAAIMFVLSRNEFVILVAFYCCVGLIFLYRNRGNIWEQIRSATGGWRFVFLVLPVAAAWSSMQCVKIYHDSRFGVRALCATEADGFADLMAALYSIEPDEKIRFIPVTYKTMEKACDASEVLAAQRKRLLDKNRAAFGYCERIVKIEGQVGPWLNWHLIDCFGGIDRNTSKRMRVAARQIRAAQSRGDLSRRRALFPVDPLWGEWLPDLPAECYAALKSSFISFNLDYGRLFDRRHLKNSVSKSLFDEGLLRRGGTGRNRQVSLSGHAVLPGSSRVVAVQILTHQEKLIVELPVTRGEAGSIEFNLSLDDVEMPDIRHALLVRLVTDASGDLKFSQPIELTRPVNKQLNTFRFASESGVSRKVDWILSLNRYSQQNKIRKRVFNEMTKWPWVGLLLVTVVALTAGFRTRLANKQIRDLAWIALATLSLLLIRNLFYCLIHVWLAWGLRRYVEPNLFIAMFAACCLVFVLGWRCSGVQASRDSGGSEADG